jgi:hypothetical protein
MASWLLPLPALLPAQREGKSGINSGAEGLSND